MYVVAGVSGRTGRVVAESLLSKAKRVRVVVRDASKGEPWRARGAEVAVASLDDPSALERALRGATGFYTLLPEDLAQPAFHEHRRTMASAICTAVKESRVPHVVLLSATAAFLPDGNGQVKHLHDLEKLLVASGSTITALRACVFQESILFALPAALHEGIFPNFMPTTDVPFPTVATRDVGRFAAGCLVEAPTRNQSVDLVGPMYSVKEMAEKLGAALGKSLRVVDLPPAAHVEVLGKVGLSREFAEALAEFYACVAAGRVSPHGDRMVAATTTLDEILPGLVGRAEET